MLFLKEKKNNEWIMTAKEAKLLSKELAYLAEEANDHMSEQYSQMILEGDGETMNIKNSKEFRIIAVPDKEALEKEVLKNERLV